MVSILTKLFLLTERLYPTGRAFREPVGGLKEAVSKALSASEADLYNEAVGVLDEILADNENFNAEDAAVWERRLAIRANSATPLADRKLAILRKYASPGNIPARQHYLFLERELQNAGFDVWVHENRPTAQNPSVYATASSIGQLGQKQLGQFNIGSSNYDIVANYIDLERDSTFVIGTNFKCLFFVGGQVKGDAANVDADRREEFRQLILQVKPLHTVGVLLINYT